MINKILHTKLIAKRNNFVNLANMKNTQGGDINFIKDKINFFKIKLKSKIQSTKNLVRKNKKFYIETIKEDSENDDISINNNIPIKFENFNKNNKIIKVNHLIKAQDKIKRIIFFINFFLFCFK